MKNLTIIYTYVCMQPSPYKKNGKRLCNPSGWWMSEKLDGFKLRWIDGTLRTRSGQEVKAPEWFTALLPSLDIEGEAYFGKNTFHKTASLRSVSGERTWSNMSFNVFDVIDYRLTWLERQALLAEKVMENAHVKIVRWQEIEDVQHLEREFNRVIADDGEGVVIADPWGLYEDGHVTQILKYKKDKDAEAVVIGYRSDKNGMRLVSLEVRPFNEPRTGITFHIGTGLKIKDRYNYEAKFPLGTVVTYTYELLGKNGKPRTPVYKGIRTDVAE